MHLNTKMIRYLDLLAAGTPPADPDPSITQSLRKQGLIIRTGADQRYQLTIGGKQALEQVQKGKQ